MSNYGRIGMGTLISVLAWTACGPNKPPECRDPLPHPTFVVTVTLPGHPLPADTTLTVYYGGNPSGETYRLANPARPEVVFCAPGGSDAGGSPEAGSGAAGSAGAGSDAGVVDDVDSLVCSLWTDGPAEVRVTSAQIAPFEQPVALSLHDGVCVYYQTIELTPLDGG